MSMIRTYKCKECGTGYSTVTGIGARHSEIQNRMLADVRDGKYGEEWQKKSLEEDFSYVDASQGVYVCPNCKRWVNEYDVSLLYEDGRRESLVRTCECGAQMQRTDSIYLECPDCKTKNDYTDRRMTDDMKPYFKL
ncbi:MAG: hypothetical protein MJ132_02645 [Clostridia bacterium]|nr:hypothetical protein [Clostridia bacterium]